MLDGQTLGRPDLLRVAQLAQAQPWELIHWAGQVRRRHFGRRVSLCCIVPGKLGGCSEDCLWCAQSARAISRPMPASRTDVNETARAHAATTQAGACRLGIVNSGRRPTGADIEHISQAMSAIADHASGATCCASLGELTPQQARELVRAGIRRYHHNLETSAGMFARMVTTHSYADRLATLQTARQAGLEICCGGLLGMGETWADRVELALTLRDVVQPDSVPLNFLHPVPGTALARQNPPSPIECLSMIAMFRLAMPTTDIRIAGGRVVNLRQLQSWMFEAGATSLMTGNYLTTTGQAAEEDRQMLQDLGMEIVDAV